LAIDHNDPSTVYGGGLHFQHPGQLSVAVAKTSDAQSGNWTITPLIACSGYIYALSVHPSNSAIVYAGGYYTEAGHRRVACFRSTDYGLNWEDASSGIDDSHSPVYDLLIHPVTSNIVYAATAGGIYRSTDGGWTWSNTDCEFSPVYALAIETSPSLTLFAGAETGVYRSSDGGVVWSGMNQGLAISQVTSIAVQPASGERVYAGTRGAGLYGLNLIGIEESRSFIIPEDSPRLYQTFPNPFSTLCTIRYSLPAPAEVRLSIYDNDGRLVRRLVQGMVNTGIHSIHWDGRDPHGRSLASSVYFCELRSGDFSVVKKMLLVR